MADYPNDWLVCYQIESEAGWLVHRENEFTVKAEPGRWYLFNRYVENGKGSEWVDAWDAKSGAFAAFLPSEINRVRLAIGQRPEDAKALPRGFVRYRLLRIGSDSR
jgi:hypothetical protein